MKSVRLIGSNILTDRSRGDHGEIRHLPDFEAEEIVRQGLAEPHGSWGVTDGVRDSYLAEEIPLVKRADAIEFPEERTAIDPADLVSAEAPPEPRPRRPYGNASKADWITWAIYQGCPEDEAAGLTKAELMSRYGERL